MQQVSSKKIQDIETCYVRYKSLRKVRDFCKISLGTAYNYVSELGLINRRNIISSVSLKDERLIGTYVGLWMGDGTQYYNHSYTIKICGNKKNEELNRFIQKIILKLFNKKTRLINEKKTNQSYVRFESKFIFDFIYGYIDKEEGKKTYSVRLKHRIGDYSNEFLGGCFLGLMLSDGFLKKRLGFNVTSKFLALNMIDILKKFGLNPAISIHDRKKYGWHDLHMVRLTKSESKMAESLLDKILLKLDYPKTFNALKNGEPGRS